MEHGAPGLRQHILQDSLHALWPSPAARCVLVQGLVVVPQQTAYVVERFGKFWKVLEPGLNVLVPAMHQIRYVYSLKEEALMVPSQVRVPGSRTRAAG